MRAMILAAGRGERMRPLTDRSPKPLLSVGGKPLIVWHIERLVAAGIVDLVINHAWLGEQIEVFLGNGARYGARIRYSPEQTALETAGGIARALPWLGSEPFLVVNSDVWCDWSPADAACHARTMQARGARLWALLAENPPQHPAGDFVLREDGRLALEGGDRLTYAGITVYMPAFFAGIDPDTPMPLAPLLRAVIAQGLAIGQRHRGAWTDVGTPQRLADLDRRLSLLSC